MELQCTARHLLESCGNGVTMEGPRESSVCRTIRSKVACRTSALFAGALLDTPMEYHVLH